VTSPFSHRLILVFCLAFLLLPGVSRKSWSVQQVELYATNWCPHCRKAEDFLRANGIEYIKFDIEQDKAAAARKSQLDQRKGVPVALINGQVLYGFSEKLYRTALDLDR
jgi:glutaredoxin